MVTIQRAASAFLLAQSSLNDDLAEQLITDLSSFSRGMNGGEAITLHDKGDSVEGRVK